MDLGNTLEGSSHKAILLTSLLHKNIVEVFKDEKDIDISEHITSIQMKDNTVLVKTGNPMINSQLLLLHDKILESCSGSLLQAQIQVDDLKIKYI